MHSILEDIILEKQNEVLALRCNCDSQTNFMGLKSKGESSKGFKNFLRSTELSVIGEIKRHSPSKGDLAAIVDPLNLLKKYLDGGVSAVSVLTDHKFFSGSLVDLLSVTNYLEHSKVPVLRKEFIIDEMQIIESALFGADAVLLIVAILKEKTQALLQFAKEVGLDVIVEVHNKEELLYAIEIGADIIGINNRNLHTFEEDINVCLELIKTVPAGILTIAESAVKTQADIVKIKSAGFNGVLIGEALVTAVDPGEKLMKIREAC